MSEKIQANVEQPGETPVTVQKHSRGRPGSRQGRETTIVGKEQKGVEILSKHDGGDGTETQVELATDQNERDEDGRRKFR